MADITNEHYIINKIHVGENDYKLNADFLGGLSTDEWKSLVGAGFNVLVVDTLPTASASTQKGIYLIADAHGNGDSYDEYVTVKSGNTYSWEKIGNTDIDISGLAAELVTQENTAGLVTGEAGAQTAVGDATVVYMESATVTGEAGAGVASNTGSAGGATINGSSFGFSGNEETIT